MSLKIIKYVLKYFSFVSGCLLSISLYSQEVNLFQEPESWNSQGGAAWSFSDSQILGREGDGFLVSRKIYYDFDLSLEFWVSAKTNSGIFIRCQDSNNINPDSCYELNIWDNHPNQDARTGAIVGIGMPPLSKVYTVGKWNTYSILARGHSIEARVNGAVTAVLERAELLSGFIALQKWNEGEVKFRRLQMKEYPNTSSTVSGKNRKALGVIDFIPGGTSSEGVTPVIKITNTNTE
mgnify:CR=1 FL=1